MQERIRILREQKRLPEARSAAQRLVALQTLRLGADHARTGEALASLGELQRLSGRTDDALSSLGRAAMVLERAPGSSPQVLWSVLRSLESIYLSRRDAARLLPIYERQLDLIPSALGPNGAKTADVLGSLAWVHHALGQEAEAESYFRRSVETLKAAKGQGDPSVAGLLMGLAGFYDEVGKVDAQIGALREALAILERSPSADPREHAGCLNQLAMLLVDGPDFAQAEPLFMRAARQYDRLTGAEGVGAAFARANAAMIREKQGDDAGAESLFVAALAQFDRTLGPNAPRSAVALNRLAALYAKRNAYDDARAAYERLIALHEHAQDATSLAVALHDLATMQLKRGLSQPAEAAFARALQVLHGAGRLESAQGAKLLSSFANYYLKLGDLPKARPLAERAHAIAEAKLEPNDRERGYVAVILAGIYKESGEYQRAEALYSQAEGVWRAAGGADAPELALSHINLAGLHHLQGNHPRAEQLLLEALEISRKAKARGAHNALAASEGLAALYAERGEYQRATPYAEEALRAWEQAGAELPGTGMAHLSLGQIYVGREDYTRARGHFERALAIHRKNSNRSAAAQVLLALAGMQNIEGDWQRAEAAYRDVAEQLKPFSSVTEKLATAHALLGVASLRLARGDFEEAEVVTRQALEAARVAGNGNPVAIAGALGLAQLLTIKKDYAGAEALLEGTERALSSAAGTEHPRLANVLFGRALIQWSRGAPAAAFGTMARGLDIQERQLSRTLSIGSEAQRALVLSGFDLGGEPAVALHASAYRAEPAAIRVAMLSILRRKGRLLDTVSGTTQALRAHLTAADAALLDELGALRGAIAARAIADADRSAGASGLGALGRRADALEAQLAARSAFYQAAVEPITLERVAAAIPVDALLVEIASYRAVNTKAVSVEQMWGTRRYAAYVLASSGALRYVDLGDAEAIERAASSFRAALAEPGSDARPAGRALDQLVMRPIRGIVGDVRRLIIAPDGVLNVVPFGAMVDERGRFLIDGWQMSYLSTGRDLIRPRDTKPRSPALVLANPTFGGSGQALGDLGTHWERLPFTEEEGREVAAALGVRKPWLGAAATKQALMQVKGPMVLHLATHGFFLDDLPRPSGAVRGLFRTAGASPQDPLLRSGLALAGANLPGAEGILTSLEASSLDLWGTKLVVLSACDTGVGHIQNGEGVYGLRRAFALAGAESIVMSLWSVQDEATRELMKAYYARLARGEGRADALRSAQLSLKQSERFGNPWHWASFVAYGDGAPLGVPLTRPGPPPVRASSGRLGCGCRTAGGEPRGVGAALPALLTVALLLRRRAARPRKESACFESEGRGRQ